MRSHSGRIAALVALTTCLIATSFGAAHAAEGWKVGVGGGRITGYMGLLASTGMPREYLTDGELADIDVLRRYRVVIITEASNPRPIAKAVEQFVAEGGIAITEEQVAPSAAAVPGQRLGPAPSPNLTFKGYDHPISRAMRSTGVITTYARPGIAIIPKDAKNVTVLGEYTDQDVPAKYRGKLIGGRAHVPAVLLIDHGKGHWLYFAPRVAFALALRGPELEPAVLAALNLMTDGVLVPRFTTLPADRRLVPQVQWRPESEEVMPRPAPRGEEPGEMPEGLEVLDLPADAPTDYVVNGTLAPGADATVMLPWFNANWNQRLEINGGRMRVIDVAGGRETVVAEGRRGNSDKSARIDIRRRPTSVTVFIDGHAALMAALTPLAGTQAASGIDDAFLQGCAPVRFTDDFMRTEGDPNPWETPAGNWELFKVDGEPQQGANPFAFHAQSEQLATAATGYWFWDDYDVGVSVRSNCDVASLVANRQADDDFLELRLTLPAMDADAPGGTLELIHRQSDRDRVLATSAAAAERDRWHRLRLCVSRGYAVASLDGHELLRVADEQVRGRGQIGLQISSGAAFFDDVRVQPWEAAPLPLNGGAWLAERGTVSATGDGVALEPAGSARAIAPMNELTDLQASAKLRRGDADSAGLLLRYQGPGDHYLLAVNEARGGGSQLQLVRTRRNEQTVLASEPLDGGAGRWHDLSVDLRGRRMRIAADGVGAIDVADDAFADGGFGLTCEGGRANFRQITCWPVDHEQYAADPETPPYAGIIDRHTWAGAGSGWEPTPDDLDRWWHRGLYVDDAEVRLGVHRTDAGTAAATLMIGDGMDAASGYALSASQPSSGEPVTISLTREGQEVAIAQVRSRGSEGWALSLQHVGSLVEGRLDGRVAVSFRDPAPLEGMRRVGFRKDAAIIDPADADVISSALRTWTFRDAPADWRVESGTWEISNRWSCSPQWTWLAGWNQDGPAVTRTRLAFAGDQRADIFVGTKMMPKPDGKGHYEELRDLHFGICEDDAGGGYHVVLGAKNNTWSAIMRNGETVVESTTYRIPSAELHNNWLLVSLVKTGPTISVRLWDREVFSYTDPDPIDSGRVSIGTARNGITVPRITVYGEPAG